MLNYNHPDYVPAHWPVYTPSELRRNAERRRRRALFASDRYVQFGVEYWAAYETYGPYVSVLERFIKKSLEVCRVRRELAYLRRTYWV